MKTKVLDEAGVDDEGRDPDPPPLNVPPHGGLIPQKEATENVSFIAETGLGDNEAMLPVIQE